ncbi:uncharacterized protein BO66DRAFT_149167 [Aspergillus aculeatinus CBS 121060]|uniref:Uncharacterized protein n=1 Tax=Aspergillus aculeatinus CBS 121060 TaxID=1448322 RepID=A0ACD1H270_9EURO|nr:hypothetical protein BO66DRAFT_149167 [Aspergillus aculeatinus CBS 121060]RAH67632.1 hypothetical protein BO66DRAFT_149167 [Aspergillus aculeatinus CBS 121060]
MSETRPDGVGGHTLPRPCMNLPTLRGKQPTSLSLQGFTSRCHSSRTFRFEEKPAKTQQGWGLSPVMGGLGFWKLLVSSCRSRSFVRCSANMQLWVGLLRQQHELELGSLGALHLQKSGPGYLSDEASQAECRYLERKMNFRHLSIAHFIEMDCNTEENE